jgi:hypothetical protein
MGGNRSAGTREVIYFRLRREGHRERWRDCVQDPFLELAPAVCDTAVAPSDWNPLRLSVTP